MSRRAEAGYALVALLATLTIGAIVLAAALPFWRYLITNDREEELIFRGGQIAAAIESYKKKNNGVSPPNLETLVRTRHLRKLYKDPMTKDGKWRLLHPGEGVNPVVPGGATPPTTQPPSPGGTGTTIGPIEGVASRSKEKSLRLFNGQSRYDQWLLKGDPTKWVIGKQGPALVPRPGASPPGGPSPQPSPSPSADQQ